MLAPKGAAAVDSGNPRPSMESTMTQRIARKPLPSTARVPHLQDAPSDVTPGPLPGVTTPNDQLKNPQLNSSSNDKENVPLGGEAAGAADPFNDAAHMPAQPPPTKISTINPQGSVVRKPLGPRPLSTGPPSPGRDQPPPYEPTPPAGAVKPAAPPTPDEDVRPNLPPRPAPGSLNLDHLPPQTFDDIYETRSPIRSPIRSPGFQSPRVQSRSPSPQSNKKPFTPFSLSIIRRDPLTGHQWNIGKVSSFQSTIIVAQDPQNPDSPKIAQYPKGYPAINVHIETSGYARFRNFPTALPKMTDLPRMSLDSARPGSSGSSARTMKELAASLQAQVEQQKGQEDTEEGFKRQVAMTYAKTWTSNLKEAFSGKKRERSSTNTSATDSTCNEPLEPPRAGFHRRQDSGNSTNSNDSMFGSMVPNPANNDPNHHHHHHHHSHHHSQHHQQHRHHGSDASATATAAATANPTSTATTPKPDEPLIATRPTVGLRPKGYTFASPWDGRCDFRTSSNGRALKCHHVRNTQSQGFNPLVAAQALRDAMPESNGGGGSGGAAGGGRTRTRGMSASLPMGDLGNRVPVSELRFNLPSSDLFNSKEDRDRAVAEMKEGLGRLLVRSPGGHEYDDADDDDKEEPIFDFSGLGREKAGGGNRGKRAKLGKLLVHDEGLKMLDLVVAANMGIWWQAWERSF